MEDHRWVSSNCVLPLPGHLGMNVAADTSCTWWWSPWPQLNTAAILRQTPGKYETCLMLHPGIGHDQAFQTELPGPLFPWVCTSHIHCICLVCCFGLCSHSFLNSPFFFPSNIFYKNFVCIIYLQKKANDKFNFFHTFLRKTVMHSPHSNHFPNSEMFSNVFLVWSIASHCKPYIFNIYLHILMFIPHSSHSTLCSRILLFKLHILFIFLSSPSPFWC